ncbi:hypothetical protein ACSSS7_003312 [Eimeria intestinalis]
MESDPVLTIKSADEVVAIHITRQRTLNQETKVLKDAAVQTTFPLCKCQKEAQGSEPARARQAAPAENKGGSIAEQKRDLTAKHATEAVRRKGRRDVDALVEVNAASTAPRRQTLLLGTESNHRSHDRGASCSRAGSAATRATRGSEAGDLSSDVGDNSIKHPAGYQSWYGGLIGLVFKHWVHTSCCETGANSTTPLSSKNFQERASVNPQVLLRRSSRSRTLAACSLQQDPLHESTASATESPLSSSGRRRRSHIEGNTEKLLSEIAAQVEGDELFYGCDDVPFEAQTERAVLALALQTPRNKKDGRGVWLLRHQHQHHITQVKLGAVAAYSNPLVKVSEVAEAQEGAPSKAHASSSAQAAARPCKQPPPDQFTRREPPSLSHAHVGGPPINESEAAFHSPASYAGGPDAPSGKDRESIESRLEFKAFAILSSVKLLVIFRNSLLAASSSLDACSLVVSSDGGKENDMILHVVLTIPLGLRHMRMTLDGSPSIDEDPDCGTWEGVVQIGSHSQQWFENGRPFLALQQLRHHKKIGDVIETRAVLPDETYGRVMTMQFHLLERKGKPGIIVNRLLKPLES